MTTGMPGLPPRIYMSEMDHLFQWKQVIILINPNMTENGLDEQWTRTAPLKCNLIMHILVGFALNANQAPWLTHTTNEVYSKVQCVTIRGHWMLKFSTCTDLSRKSSIISDGSPSKTIQSRYYTRLSKIKVDLTTNFLHCGHQVSRSFHFILQLHHITFS
jgi:hypothetical protein